jgi:simple sugar transport system substrate-binding protein
VWVLASFWCILQLYAKDTFFSFVLRPNKTNLIHFLLPLLAMSRNTMYKNLSAKCVAVLTLFFLFLNAKAQEPLKVAFVYISPISNVGWVHQHDLGRRAIEEAFNKSNKAPLVKTTYVESVSEGPDAERVIRDLAKTGHQLIFTPSFGYMDPTIQVAKEFPKVRFESVTGYKRADNVATSNARYYEGRYLAGIAAAKMSKNHLAGYVAAFPIPEVLQGINAFVLGMRAVDPQAKLKVVWVNSWFNPSLERDAAESLINQGADVLAYHTGTNAVMQVAQEKSVWAIAYHSDLSSMGPSAQLLAVTHHWEKYDVSRVKALLEGSWKSKDTWGGLREGMVDLGAWHDKVPLSVKKEVEEVKKQIIQGKTIVFKGPLWTQDAKKIIKEGDVLTDGQVQQMNYLLDGVTTPLPMGH